MVLEATVIVLDNSEWMRNGDYLPTRLDAQNDAVQLLCNAKRQANVENAVALVSMGGDCPKVLVTLTSEQSKLLHAINSMGVGVGNGVNFISALKVAQLVLKHRQNPNQRQRIVAFVGSPLSFSNSQQLIGSFEETGSFLKKNNVALDIVSFGNVQENEALLSALLGAVSIGAGDALSSGSSSSAVVLAEELQSHILPVHPGTMGSLADALMASPILTGSVGSASGGGIDGGFGIDADMDPELAMALKLSLEEEQARQAAAAAAVAANAEKPEDKDMMATEGEAEVEDEDAMMQQAIAMSLEQEHTEKK